jgi:hypothetical protein
MNWPFAILLDGMDENGNIIKKDFRPLFGLDLLACFNFSINNEKDYFEFNRLKEFKRRQIRFTNQEIHEMI